jgi:hypothetical protein
MAITLFGSKQCVIQVLQSVRTSFFSTTSATFSDVLTQTITPSSATSKILIMCTGQECTDAGDGNTYSQHLLLRDSTSIYIGDASGSALRSSAGRFGRQSDFLSDAVSFMYLDSPNTTSAITYKWQARSTRGPSWRVSVGGSVRTGADDARVPSNMIVMEVIG